MVQKETLSLDRSSPYLQVNCEVRAEHLLSTADPRIILDHAHSGVKYTAHSPDTARTITKRVKSKPLSCRCFLSVYHLAGSSGSLPGRLVVSTVSCSDRDRSPGSTALQPAGQNSAVGFISHGSFCWKSGQHRRTN